MRRFLRINFGLVCVGLGVATLWVLNVGGREFLDSLAGVHLAYVVPLILITAFNIFLRFLRWQFLLRSVDVRIPARPSFSAYLASLAGIATPAYAGELIRGVFVRRRFGVPLRLSISVIVAERLLDVAALGMIAALTANSWLMRGLMSLFFILPWLGAIMGRRLIGTGRIPPFQLNKLGELGTLARAFAISIVAWASAGLLVTFAAASLDIPLSPGAGLNIFSSATLLGSLTLMPAGIGSTGSLAILQLQEAGLTLSSSVVAISLMRLSSAGLALSVGVVFLYIELIAIRPMQKENQSIHFDDIAEDYRKQFPDHVWQLLLRRKMSLVMASVPAPELLNGPALDLGCGLGHQARLMREGGFRIVGLDMASGLLRYARNNGIDVTNGTALALPFADATFEFVYTVGVLHHLPNAAIQAAAVREVTRVLRPGGLFIVHETNPLNAFFRFYMQYIFPLLKSIDEGTERWIEPKYWTSIVGMKYVDMQHFTFLPDFIPQGLLPPILGIERRLEGSAFRPYSVHYMAVLQKESLPGSPAVSSLAAQPLAVSL